MDAIFKHLKNLVNTKIFDAYNKGWNDCLNHPDVKKALERLEPKKVIQKRLGDIPVHCCPDCGYSYDSFCVREMRVKPEACPRCGQALDWGE